ncbi:hypothetical protein [Candidatus Villigracilis affinis]|uniref:hypothetical protein n=1 Tax=Candidatus Villigracilis affinis TaxID=3140682 RepID=UPI002A204336|nr:hypothetical protein [Anaerolineales bacterium]
MVCKSMRSYDAWQKLLNYLPEDSDQDRFLRQFYNAFKFDPNIKIGNITRAPINIITIYETLIKKDAKGIFDQLSDKAEFYNQLIEPEEYEASTLNTSLVNLERIGAVPSYTFLLYLFSLDESNYAEPDLQ